uniref:CSON010681 protein n=1 Tax=Culicoides sonorensis TaxID=179676 RepID=A0A336K0C6_CULSO
MKVIEPSKKMTNESSSSVIAKRHEENCLGCRLVSGGGLLGISGYVYSQVKKQNSAFSKACLLTISTGVAGLGIARVFDLYPFKHRPDGDKKIQ